MLLYFLSILTFSSVISYSLADDAPSTYNGAVVEHYASGEVKNFTYINETFYPVVVKRIADRSFVNYESMIKFAKDNGTDIIIFPEYGLTGIPRAETENKTLESTAYRKYFSYASSYLPRPDEQVILCGSDKPYKEWLKQISCVAQRNRIYVVINHLERVDCEGSKGCPDDKHYIYNSNVVFDRNGRVIAVYRKHNLLNEPGINKPNKPKPSIFTTDFNVTFGQLISTDILLEQPTLDYMKHPNLSTVVMPTMWIDELPLIGLSLYEAGWSYRTDLDLLVASYGGIEGTSGCGVYAGTAGPVEIYRPAIPRDRILRATIPRNRSDNRINNNAFLISLEGILPIYREYFERDFPFDCTPHNTKYLNSEILNFTENSYERDICFNDVCCNFSMILHDSKFFEEYDNRIRAIVYVGPHKLSTGRIIGLEVCAFVLCENENLDSCNSTEYEGPFKPKTIAARISKTVPHSRRAFYVPVTRRDLYLPLSPSEFNYTEIKNANNTTIILEFIPDDKEISYFGIYGRRFDLDEKLKIESHISKTFAFKVIWKVILIVASISIFFGTYYIRNHYLQRNSCI